MADITENMEKLSVKGKTPKFNWDINASAFVPGNSNPRAPAPAVAAIPTPTPAPVAKKPASKPTEIIKTANPAPSTTPAEQKEKGGPKSVFSSTKIKIARNIKLEKEHLNVIFIGHVDAGKSTIGGHIMVLTDQVDQRTLEKYKSDAKDMGRESWYLSWALDTNDEERAKGKTVEVGRAHFFTEKKKFTILDAPGHNLFIANMISGVSQADIGILVVSARRGEFEAGFDRDGQTREHAMLAKTAGVKFLIILINKMDDPSVEWSVERYDEIIGKLQPFLKKNGYNSKTVHFMPCSGYTGENIKEPLAPGRFDKYKGPSLLTFLDQLKPMNRGIDLPVRLPIQEKFKDMGIMIAGKLESGVIEKGKSYTLMPNKSSVETQQIFVDDVEVDMAIAGNNVKLKIKGTDEDDISVGHMLCEDKYLINSVQTFDAIVQFMNLGNLVTSGYKCVLHAHAIVDNVIIKKLIQGVDDKGVPDKTKMFPKFARSDQVMIVRLQVEGRICVETFKDFAQLGRITLRDEKKTVGIGKILKLVA